MNDGWMDGCIHDGWMYTWIDRWMDGCILGRMDGCVGG